MSRKAIARIECERLDSRGSVKLCPDDDRRTAIVSDPVLLERQAQT